MNNNLEWIDIKKELSYNGSQLSCEWIKVLSQSDNIIVSFTGPCNVEKEFMVDMEDLNQGCLIKSDKMLHFIIKHRSFSLPFIVYAQRLFVSLIKEVLESSYKKPTRRSGDDLFFEGGKLNISVATFSEKENAGLIHTALNITSLGTPPDVETSSLEEMGINGEIIKSQIVNSYLEEWTDIFHAAKKVKTL
jgi:hypothetical protein